MLEYTDDEIHQIMWCCKDWDEFYPYLVMLGSIQIVEKSKIMENANDIYGFHNDNR